MTLKQRHVNLNVYMVKFGKTFKKTVYANLVLIWLEPVARFALMAGFIIRLLKNVNKCVTKPMNTIKQANVNVTADTTD